MDIRLFIAVIRRFRRMVIAILGSTVLLAVLSYGTVDQGLAGVGPAAGDGRVEFVGGS
jgi:hypothetical protein